MTKRKFVFSCGDLEISCKSLPSAREAYRVAEMVLTSLSVPREDWPVLIIRSEAIYGG